MKRTQKIQELVWNGPVNKANLLKFVCQLGKLPRQRSHPTLFLDSRGGTMDIALAFHQLVMALDLRLTVVARSHLYSVGVFLFACGYRRLMTPHATLNFHELVYSLPETDPPFSKIERAYNETSVAHGAYIALIVEASDGKLETEDVAEIMRNEIRFSAKEALKIGLAHKVLSD